LDFKQLAQQEFEYRSKEETRAVGGGRHMTIEGLLRKRGGNIYDTYIKDIKLKCELSMTSSYVGHRH